MSFATEFDAITDYSDLVSDKVSDNSSFITSLTSQKSLNTATIAKITAIQNLSSSNKITLYDAWSISEYEKLRFLSIAMDRSGTMITRFTAVIDDTLSTTEKKLLLNIIINEEYSIQRKSTTNSVSFLIEF